MAASFSSYIPRESGMHRLHPMTKLVIALLGLALGMLLPGIWSAYLAFLVFIVPLALWGGILLPLLRAALKVVLPFAISLLLVQGLFWPGGTPILELGPFALKQEGLDFAIRGTGRILMLVSSFLLLLFTTRADELMLALGQRGVPSSITYVLLATLQIAPRFQSKANTILDAQRSRGLETEGNLLVRARALLPLVQPLLLGSIVDIEERAIALEVRAFGAKHPKTSLIVLRDTSFQKVARWLLLGLIVALVGFRVYLFIASRQS